MKISTPNNCTLVQRHLVDVNAKTFFVKNIHKYSIDSIYPKKFSDLLVYLSEEAEGKT